MKLFARLRDIAGRADLDCDVPDRARVRDVWSAVVARHPGLAPYAQSISCAINADYARMDDEVAEGNEIAFLPPVSGG